jgi:pimeloyl-ACP methyl ester carboxylesterase
MSTPLLPPQVREIFPFENRFADVEGHRLHYVDEGPRDGPVVLLLHGNPTWAFLYREIIPRIAGSVRTVAPDFLGMGLSAKPHRESLYTLETHTRLFTAFVEALGLRDLILVMQDWGGPIGLGYAVANRANVSGALIMNTWAWPEPSPFHAAVDPWRTMHAPLIGSYLMLRRNILVERGLYLSIGTRRERLRSGPVLDGYRAPFEDPASRIGMLAWPRNIPLAPGHFNWDRMARLHERLRGFDAPCRLLWGAKDVVFPLENAARFQALLPDCSEPRVISEGRHFIQEDAPEEIAEEILSLVGGRP